MTRTPLINLPTRRLPCPRLVFTLLGLLLVPACAGRRAISGQVVDRNGTPLDRVVISVEPGNVEIVTDAEGRFVLNYLRDADGARRHIQPRTDYSIEAFQVGYHVARTRLSYRNGQQALEPITLAPDRIRLDPSDVNIDPALHPDVVRYAGATYEGE